MPHDQLRDLLRVVWEAQHGRGRRTQPMSNQRELIRAPAPDLAVDAQRAGGVLSGLHGQQARPVEVDPGRPGEGLRLPVLAMGALAPTPDLLAIEAHRAAVLGADGQRAPALEAGQRAHTRDPPRLMGPALPPAPGRAALVERASARAGRVDAHEALAHRVLDGDGGDGRPAHRGLSRGIALAVFVVAPASHVPAGDERACVRFPPIDHPGVQVLPPLLGLDFGDELGQRPVELAALRAAPAGQLIVPRVRAGVRSPGAQGRLGQHAHGQRRVDELPVGSDTLDAHLVVAGLVQLEGVRAQRRTLSHGQLGDGGGGERSQRPTQALAKGLLVGRLGGGAHRVGVVGRDLDVFTHRGDDQRRVKADLRERGRAHLGCRRGRLVAGQLGCDLGLAGGDADERVGRCVVCDHLRVVAAPGDVTWGQLHVCLGVMERQRGGLADLDVGHRRFDDRPVTLLAHVVARRGRRHVLSRGHVGLGRRPSRGRLDAGAQSHQAREHEHTERDGARWVHGFTSSACGAMAVSVEPGLCSL